MKNFSKIMRDYLVAVFISATFLLCVSVAMAQQLKPKEIIYSRLPTDLNSAPTVWAVGQDGGGDRQIAVGMEPRISDDGRYLLYRRIIAAQGDVLHYNPYINEAHGQLWVRDLMNNSETLIFDFSTGNRRLLGYFFSPYSNQGNYQIIFDYGTLFYKMNLDGTGRVAIDPYSGGGVPREGDNFPVLRRGDSLLAANNRQRPDFGLVTRTLGSEPAFDVPNTNGGDYNPLWSNDNQLLGFTTLGANRNFIYGAIYYPYFFSEISKIKPDGTGRTLLLDLNANEQSPNGFAYGTVWTENNTKIIAAARIGGIAGLYALNTDGSGTRAKIPISAGNAPDFVGGIVQTREEQSLISSGGGLISDSSVGLAEMEAPLAGQYTMNTSIGEPIVGDLSGGSFSLSSGFQSGVTFTPAGGGYEGDVQSRPYGDSFVDSDDVQQARRYSVGLDNYLFADGSYPQPATESENLQNNEKSPFQFDSIVQAPGAFRIDNQSTSAGQTIVVPVRVDTVGNEAGYTFSISYDSTKLTNPQVTIGNAGGDVIFNSGTAGQIGFSVTSFAGGTIAAGSNLILVNVTFRAANAPGGTTNIAFTDTPARRKASGVDPNTPITQPTYTNGIIIISGTTAAGATVSGRVLIGERGLSNARVNLTDQRGEMQTAITNLLGFYHFDEVTTGKTYIVSVSHKRYRFAPQVVNVNEQINELNFTAAP